MGGSTQDLVACVSVDRHGVIRDANNAAHDVTGHDDLVGRHLSSIVPPRLHGRFYARFARQLQTGASRTVRLPVRRVDGRETTTDLTIHVVPASRPLQHRAAQLI